jgi:hypothetical protein
MRPSAVALAAVLIPLLTVFAALDIPLAISFRKLACTVGGLATVSTNKRRPKSLYPLSPMPQLDVSLQTMWTAIEVSAVLSKRVGTFWLAQVLLQVKIAFEQQRYFFQGRLLSCLAVVSCHTCAEAGCKIQDPCL